MRLYVPLLEFNRYWLARTGGSWVARILHLTPKRLERYESFFDRYGAWAVFFARFITGLRIIAGPAAGLTRMPWPRFALFNGLGAGLWVTTISLVGFFLGRQWQTLIQWVQRMDLVLLILAVFAGLYLIRRHARTEG